MLKRIVASTNTKDTILLAYQRFMMGIIADRDISAHETCHMLLKLPLISCTHQFVSLNVGKKVFQRVTNSAQASEASVCYILAYIRRPPHLADITLLVSAQQFSYNQHPKKGQWLKRKCQAIVNVYP